MTSSDEQLVAGWLQTLDVEPVSENRFVSHASGREARRWGASFMCQSLFAAARTSALTRPLSLQAIFLRPATWMEPMSYEVERLRDGRRLVTRCVRAFQNNKPVGICTITFGQHHDHLPGHLEHQPALPQAPAPESIGDWWEELATTYSPAMRGRRTAWDLRSVGSARDQGPLAPGELPWRRSWCRPRSPLPDNALVHAAAILTVSDTALTATVGLAYPKTRPTSLDHAVWWHDEARFDDWLLYASESPVGRGSLALIHGAFHNREGRRVVSVTQECMVPDVPAGGSVGKR